MVKRSNPFLLTLLITIMVFGIGLILGFFLESSRADRVEFSVLESEISLLDQQIRNRGLNQFNISCEMSKQSTFDFADKIYQDALKLEKFDSSSKFIDSLKTTHKRYDLLRVLLWMEGINLKEQCKEELHTVVYIFDYATEKIEIKAKQAALSRLLLDLKNKHGDKVLLIPIAGNLELESVNLAMNKYGITKIPAILIDEEKIIKASATLEELERIVFEMPGFQELEGTIYREAKASMLKNSEETLILN